LTYPARHYSILNVFSYAIAASLADQLDALARGLSTMIDSVNDLTSGPSAQAKDDPVAQISAILNAHLESLQWIDGAVRDAEERVQEIEGSRTGAVDNSGARSTLGMSAIGSSFSASTTAPRRGRYGL
jgi:nuclear pore complex protein Nup62